ncbi:MAG TPA: ABC transporter ATP-binding protein, partial [Actinobacteria bacterium]|nr:ABC transporter ATP-binding protein [Actinomycetota bacterium]
MTTNTASDAVMKEAEQSERMIRGQGMRLIRRQLSRAPRQFLVGGAGTVLFAAATVASSYVIGWVTDSVLLPSVAAREVTTATLAGAGAAIVGVSTITAAGIALRRVGAYAAQYHLQARDRTEITDRYLELPIEWHRRHPTGQLLSNVNADVEAASQIAAPLPMAFGVAVMLAITTVLLVTTDPFLALVGLLILPSIALANYAFQRKMRVIAASAQKLRAEVSEIAHESFDAALVVKTLGREDAEVGRFGSRSDDLRDQMVSFGRLRAAFDPIMEALPTIGVLAVVVVGAWRVDQGLITPGNLVTFAYLFRLIAMPMRVFTWLLGQIPAATAGWQRIQAVLDTDAKLDYGKIDLVASGGASADAKSVGYVYPEGRESDLGETPGSEAVPAPEESRGV